MPNPIAEFLQQKKLDGTSEPLLKDFVQFLTERGQFIPAEDLQKHFTEGRTVEDKNKKRIKINRCVVCGHEEYEILDED